jgi:RNA ligase (TIGR02306 family)
MSMFSVPLVEVQGFGRHPNADTLSITNIEGCPVIFRTDDLQRGDLAVYIPVDSVVPIDTPAFNFLAKSPEDLGKGKTVRVKARRLRGIFSMGLLIPAKDLPLPGAPELHVGEDYGAFLGVVKYEEPDDSIGMNTGNRRDPGILPVYDLEPYRKHKGVLVPGEEVVVYEKLHGCNGRAGFVPPDGVTDHAREFTVGSHNTWKLRDDNNLWWKAVIAAGIEEKLRAEPDYGIYFEAVGPDAQKESVSKMWYGRKGGDPFPYVFDVMHMPTRRILDEDERVAFCQRLDLPHVPLLYRGPYVPEVVEPLAEGKSLLGNHIREGFVIRPVKERHNHRTGRTVIKLVGEGYLLRGGGTERH